MILFPAIDLKDGNCVRLLRGDMAKATLYNRDPGDQARRFAVAGFRWLHVVDLDGAVAGQAVNLPALQSVIEAAPTLKVQLGGGMRSLDDIESRLRAGVERVVLGTLALRQPALVRDACRRFPGRIVLGLDARRGKVAVAGWQDQSATGAHDLAKSYEDAGAAAIVYTDIERDGALTGPAVGATVALAEAVRLPVIASGGIAGAADLRALTRAAATCDGVIAGAICGRALYDGRLDAAEGLAIMGRGGC